MFAILDSDLVLGFKCLRVWGQQMPYCLFLGSVCLCKGTGLQTIIKMSGDNKQTRMLSIVKYGAGILNLIAV